MAFKPMNWQSEQGIEPSEKGSLCAICDSTFNNGICRFVDDTTNAERVFNLCEFHSHMTYPGLELVHECKIHGCLIAKQTFEEGRWNSFDRDSMIQFMSDELIIEQTEYTMKNCARTSMPATTYEDALQLYAKELVRRLRPLQLEPIPDSVQ